MIWVQGAVWLAIACIAVSMGRSGWPAGLFGFILFAIDSIFFLEQLRFAFPVEWRVRWPKWDSFLCRIGSHRCVPICGSRCCWECIRCSPDSPSVKRYFETLSKLRSN